VDVPHHGSDCGSPGSGKELSAFHGRAKWCSTTNIRFDGHRPDVWPQWRGTEWDSCAWGWQGMAVVSDTPLVTCSTPDYLTWVHLLMVRGQRKQTESRDLRQRVELCRMIVAAVPSTSASQRSNISTYLWSVQRQQAGAEGGIAGWRQQS
jgi:hypothetical protein